MYINLLMPLVFARMSPPVFPRPWPWSLPLFFGMFGPWPRPWPMSPLCRTRSSSVSAPWTSSFSAPKINNNRILNSFVKIHFRIAYFEHFKKTGTYYQVFFAYNLPKQYPNFWTYIFCEINMALYLLLPRLELLSRLLCRDLSATGLGSRLRFATCAAGSS